MKWLIPWAAAIVLLSGRARAENDLRVVEGELRFWNRPFEVWGAAVPDWRRLVSVPEAIRDTFQVLADRGVNTVGISLQTRGPGRSLFSPDGRPVDPETARRFTQVTALVRDHAMACVISLFASDRSCWLQSPAAYEQAVQNAARLLAVKHTTVFVVGDLFGDGQWSPECPGRLDDPARVIELCRLMKKTKSEVLVGFPGSLLKRMAAGSRQALFYFADSVESLESLVDASRNSGGAALPRGVIAVDSDCFFRPGAGEKGAGKDLEKYLQDVERRRLAVRAPLPATASAPAEGPLTAKEKAEGFVPLFNGRDLDGWTTLRADWSTWSVEDGAIKCSGADGQWLRSRKRFASFILRFEFKIVRNGNSGIFVWSPLEARSSRFGMEMQILGVERDKPDDNTTGAIYGVQPPRQKPDFKIDDWNNAEIMCKGSKIRVILNGQVVQDFDADQVPKLKGRLRRGVIGLQDHASPVWFRNLRIKELDAAP